MTYHIDVSSLAKADVDAAFLTISQFTTALGTQLWYQGLIKAITSLREMPRRCSIAREDAFYLIIGVPHALFVYKWVEGQE